MAHDKVFEELGDFFLQAGFNLTLSVNPVEYDSSRNIPKRIESLLRNAKSVILVGFGGNSFWEIFQNYLRENPDFKTNHINLIDDYTELKFLEVGSILEAKNVQYRPVYPFGENGLDLNFIRLGELAGAGVQSLLGILLHPVYGPWVSLRGAFITDMELSSFSGPIGGFAPCPSCDKPCISVCPAQTISPSGWDWESCIRFRLEDETCATSCASRRACPFGKDVQYSDEQMEYHHRFVLKSARKYFNQKS